MRECKGLPKLQKTLAFAIFVKLKLGRSSLMQNYTINRLHTLTGISATTIKKYLPIAIRKGWVHFNGKHNQHLVVSKLCSQTSNRNINIDRFCFDSFIEVYRSIRAFLALIIQSHKDFIKRTIQSFKDPKTWKEFKAARNIVKRLVRKGLLEDMHDEYKEYGLSYKRIARETGNCVKTAQKIIKYAIKHKWVYKFTHSEQHNVPNTNYRNSEFFTFSTRNNVYRVFANTYTLNKCVSDAVSDPRWIGNILVGKK